MQLDIHFFLNLYWFQLHHEIQPFTSYDSSDFGLMSAPVLLHMEDLQAGSDESYKHSKVDIKKVGS